MILFSYTFHRIIDRRFVTILRTYSDHQFRLMQKTFYVFKQQLVFRNENEDMCVNIPPHEEVLIDEFQFRKGAMTATFNMKRSNNDSICVTIMIDSGLSTFTKKLIYRYSVTVEKSKCMLTITK